MRDSPHPVVVLPAFAPDDLVHIRALFEEYAASLGFDLAFQGFAQEVETLPGAYAPPAGALFLAIDRCEIVGCVGVRPLGDDACEMKRLYVRPHARRSGAGRHLALAALRAGALAGYRVMRLDTIASMTAARTLYSALGFREIAPYCFNPLLDAVYMEADLRTHAAAAGVRPRS